MSGQQYYGNNLPAEYLQQQYGSTQQTYQYPPPNSQSGSSTGYAQRLQQYTEPQALYQDPSQSSQSQQYDESPQYEQAATVPQPSPAGQLPLRSFKDYLRALPMFPLLTENEAKAKQKTANAGADLYNTIQPEPQLTGFQKLTLQLVDATAGGGLMNVRKMENGMTKFVATSTTNLATDGNPVTLTRWSYMPDDTGKNTAGIVMVDVLQCRRSKSLNLGMSFNSAYVKGASAGSETVMLMVLGKNIKIKGDKMWNKNMSSKDVDEVLLVLDKGSTLQMEPLMTVQVTMSLVEFAEAAKRFEHGWKVPRL